MNSNRDQDAPAVSTKLSTATVHHQQGVTGTLSHWVWRGTSARGCSPWSRSICTQLPEPTAGSRTPLYAPLQDSQQHPSLSGEHKGQNSSGSAKAPAVLSKPTPPPLSSKTSQYSQVKFLRLTPILVSLSEQEIASLSVGAGYNEGSV